VEDLTSLKFCCKGNGETRAVSSNGIGRFPWH